MISRDFKPKRRKKGVIRIIMCPPTKKLTSGKVIINAINFKSKNNVRAECGIADIREMIRLFDKLHGKKKC